MEKTSPVYIRSLSSHRVKADIKRTGPRAQRRDRTETKGWEGLRNGERGCFRDREPTQAYLES